MRNPPELSPEDHQNREVHARFSLAMYHAQAVEASIKSALVLAKLNESAITNQDDFDDVWNANFTATMGQLLIRFKPYLAEDEELGEDLELARKLRNQFAHHFFWDHTQDILSRAGRQRMIDECAAAVDFFRKLNDQVFAVSRQYADAMGIRTEPFAEALAVSKAEKAEGDTSGRRACGRCVTQMASLRSARRSYWECPTCHAVALT